jgi:dihydroflavonol-4-reductase
MKTLVTGAAGFIGAHVTRKLVERGREVRAMLAPNEDASPLDGLDVEIVRGDIRDPEACRAAVQGCRRAFHLAAIYKIWTPDDKVIFDVNVTGSANLLWACLRAGVERVVYTSSIAAIGQRDDGLPADEETPFNLWRDANAYIRSKYVSEQVALTFAREGLPLVVVNPTFPFGAGDRAPTPTGQILLNTLNRRSPGILDGGFNAVDVEDVAEGHLGAEERGRVGERYILGNVNFLFKDFVRLIAEVTGRAVPSRTVPYPVYYGIAAIAEMVSDRFTHKHPIATRKAVKYVHRPLFFDPSKARRELGLPQTDIRDTIRKAVQWFEEHGYLNGQRR